MENIGHKALSSKIAKGEVVYFINDFEQIAIKMKAGAICVAKPKGGTGYSIDEKSPIVIDGMLEGAEITEQEYNDY